MPLYHYLITYFSPGCDIFSHLDVELFSHLDVILCHCIPILTLISHLDVILLLSPGCDTFFSPGCDTVELAGRAPPQLRQSAPGRLMSVFIRSEMVFGSIGSWTLGPEHWVLDFGSWTPMSDIVFFFRYTRYFNNISFDAIYRDILTT